MEDGEPVRNQFGHERQVMSISAPKVRLSWIEHFMNWYPRNTKLYRRRSKNDPTNVIALMSAEFDELKPFFVRMQEAIRQAALEEAAAKLRHEAIEHPGEGTPYIIAAQIVEALAKDPK